MEGTLQFDLMEPGQQAVMRTMLRAADMVLCMSAWRDTIRAKLEELEDADPMTDAQILDRDTRLTVVRELSASFEVFLLDYDLVHTVNDPDRALGVA